ncbi:hypothetical protein HOD08_00250, partial [bacterium]|nr:hypothetical protein [bacterium]
VDGALSEGTGDSAAAQKDKKIGELNTLRGVPLISFLLRFKRSRYFSKTLSRVALYGLRYHIARTKTLMQRDAGMVRIMVSEIAARVKKEMSWKPWNPIDWKDKLLYYDLFRTCDETLRKMGSSAGDLRDQLTEYKTSAAKFSNLGAGKQPVIALYKIRHLINNKRRYDEPKKEAFVIGINELEKLLKTTNKYADALKGEGKEEVHKDSFFHYLEKSFNETIARVGWKWWHISGWKDKGLRVPIKGIFSEARSGGLYEIYNEDLKKTVDEYNNPGHSIWSDLSRATAFESAGWPTQKQIEDGTDSHDSTVGDYSWENKNTPTSTQQSEIPTMKDGEDEQPQGTRTPTRSDGESMVPM